MNLNCFKICKLISVKQKITACPQRLQTATSIYARCRTKKSERTIEKNSVVIFYSAKLGMFRELTFPKTINAMFCWSHSSFLGTCKCLRCYVTRTSFLVHQYVTGTYATRPPCRIFFYWKWPGFKFWDLYLLFNIE